MLSTPWNEADKIGQHSRVSIESYAPHLSHPQSRMLQYCCSSHTTPTQQPLRTWYVDNTTRKLEYTHVHSIYTPMPTCHWSLSRAADPPRLVEALPLAREMEICPLHTPGFILSIPAARPSYHIASQAGRHMSGPSPVTYFAYHARMHASEFGAHRPRRHLLR